MEPKRRRLPSPAMSVALVALFVALSGGAYATVALNQVVSSSIKNGEVKNPDLGTASVGTLKMKDGAVTSAKIATNAVTSAKIASVAATKVTGAVGVLRPRWALVSANGSIIAQSGGISIAAKVTGGYYVNFGSPQTGRVIHTSIHYGSQGFVGAAICGATTAETTFCFALNTNTTSHVFVQTLNTAGTQADQSFYISSE